ncbi:MAG: di-trans,poly-cis-decaprenylcistransferase [Acidimicrobiia bacterium]|nr:di-trans,poly-cis-decaprenylcistransferase [Acidimicrobiia bacterium]
MLDPDRIPRHIAIIMDGNGRWANQRDLPRTAGHVAGETTLFDTIDRVSDLGVAWLTVYAFSTENWSRSDEEVAFLMAFNESLLVRHRDHVAERGIRIHFMGLVDDERIPANVRRQMRESEEITADNEGMRLVFAFNYGGRADIVQAVRAIAHRVEEGSLLAGDVDEETVAGSLMLPDMPDPEMVIRTSGEQRLSNFLTWQSAYSELVFTDVLWPDFDEQALHDCLIEYQGRDRRFGGAADE